MVLNFNDKHNVLIKQLAGKKTVQRYYFTKYVVSGSIILVF